MAYDEILAARLRAQLSPLPGMLEKKMFGGIGFILGGNMALGVLGGDLLVRVPPVQYESLLQEPNVGLMDNYGRVMKNWVKVAPPGFESEPGLQKWIDIGLAAARALPKK